MKKVLAIVLAVVMACSLVVVTSAADEDEIIFDLSEYTSHIANYDTGLTTSGWCPAMITQHMHGETMSAFVAAVTTEGAYIEVISTPNADGGDVSGILFQSYSLEGGSKYTWSIYGDELAVTTDADGKTHTTFDAASAVEKFESTPHEDDPTGETMCSLSNIMTVGMDVPDGAVIYNILVKTAPIIVTNGDGTPIGCETIETALDAVQENGTITLNQNITVGKQVELSKPGVTLDLGGNTLTASESFTYTDRTNLNDAHVVNISADNVKVCNGTIKSTVNNKHCLNVYKATGVVVEGLTLDHTNANAIKGGAPMVVGGSDVTVKGRLTTITGTNSWYAINVDSYAGMESNITFAQNSTVAFEGVSPLGIYIETNSTADTDDVTVTFDKNVSVIAPEGVSDFTAVATDENATNASVVNPGNAGLKDNGDGTYGVAPIETSKKISGCIYLNEDYHALIVNGRFIVYPHADNGSGFCTACKGVIVADTAE